jgi:7-cyano-7-deazaguanine synthase
VKPKAVVLLSGGIDSATVLAIARKTGYDTYVLSVNYGQRHQLELAAAKKIALALGAKKHLFIRLDLAKMGGSALTGAIPVPKGRSEGRMAETIPVTYVPARNTILLSMAVGWAETIGAFDVFIGVNAVDYSGYPDCRPAFIRAFERTVNLGTKTGVEGGRFKIHTPLMRWTKARIIREGRKLGVPFKRTHSCYDPDKKGRACGRCDSCLIRKKGFREAGVADPTWYVNRTPKTPKNRTRKNTDAMDKAVY